jgi:FlaG/FlaF family flagellin (archaellin)
VRNQFNTERLKMKNRIAAVSASVALTAFLAGCSNDAQVASYNLSQAADNFKIARRIVFYNGVTNDYMLEIRGLCSQEQTDKKLAVTCKTGEGQYKKHFLGLSDNVTYFSEQIDGADVSAQHYKITFKPSVILPAIDLR